MYVLVRKVPNFSEAFAALRQGKQSSHVPSIVTLSNHKPQPQLSATILDIMRKRTEVCFVEVVCCHSFAADVVGFFCWTFP